MKPLTLNLSLLIQSFKKVAFRHLYSESFEAQKEAKKFFGIEVPLILDTRHKLEWDTLLVSKAVGLAEYDWHYDVNRVFHKKISTLCEKYDVDFELVICFCICHETGHAKEQRLFEEIGFFPNTMKRLPNGVCLKIENAMYLTTNHSLYDRFSCGISDFSINELLSEHNIKNQLAKKIFLDTTNQSPNAQREERSILVLDTLLHLPIVLDIYEHSDLDENQKRILKESQENIVGDKWEQTLSTLRRINFFDPLSTIETKIDLFKKTLGISAFLGSKEKSETLFSHYSTLPKFWNKKEYRVMYLL